MSAPSSPKPAKKEPQIDTSLKSWLLNIHKVTHCPATVVTVMGLLVAGAFAETAPRKTLGFLDNQLGHALFFIVPVIIAVLLDWATGLLAAVICLIVFARLQRSNESDDDVEGFASGTNIHDSVQTTKLISNPHRWFVEKVLGEMPVAISSDRIQTKRAEDNDSKTSSSSSMSSSHTSDGTK